MIRAVVVTRRELARELEGTVLHRHNVERLTAADAGHRMWRRAVTRSLAWADGG